MYFDYFPVGTSQPIITRIRDIDLAKYIATDWIPSVPPAVINGLTAVVHGALNSEKVYLKDYWCANRDLSVTDRQWSGVTSWIIGVAFARFVIEKEGYPWWSPVSAFRGTNASGKTKTGHWLSPTPRTNYSIEKSSASTSRLLPDYLVCGNKSNFAFVESKGTKKAIANAKWNTAPSDWSQQAKNAELFFKKKPVPVQRRIVVATRLNPSAAHSKTRRIVVRAWNSKNSEEIPDNVLFAHFLANHYAAMCWRLGYTQLANLMEMVGQTRFNGDSDTSARFFREHHAEEFRSWIYGLIDPNFRRISQQDDVGVLEPPQNQTRFMFGDRILSVALTSFALDIMRALVNRELSDIIEIASTSVDRLEGLRDFYSTDQQSNMAVTLNGIAIYDQFT